MTSPAVWILQRYHLKILEQHLDSYGHVNNATYLTLLEEARWDFITRGGYGYERVHQLKQGPVVLEAHLTFKKELRLREEITIESQVLDYIGKVGTLRQVIYNSSGDVCSDALFKFGFFDLKLRKLVNPTPEWLQALGLQNP